MPMLGNSRTIGWKDVSIGILDFEKWTERNTSQFRPSPGRGHPFGGKDAFGCFAMANGEGKARHWMTYAKRP